MSSEAKTVTAIIIVTILIIVGGIFIMQGATSNQPTVTVNPDILVRPDSPVLKAPDEKIVMVEFADYECPSCAALYPAIKQLLASDDGKYVTLVYRNFPIHGGSVQASEAVQAAGAQGKYWEMHDMVFENQDEWTTVADSDTAGRAAFFEKYATAIGLDITKYRADLSNPAYPKLITRDQADGISMNIDATPTVIIDGKQVFVGAISYDKLKAMIDADLAAKANGTDIGTTTTDVGSSTTLQLK